MNCLFIILGGVRPGPSRFFGYEIYVKFHLQTILRTGDMLTGEEFESYCEKMMNTPAWGGQIELKALSKFLKRQIQVSQFLLKLSNTIFFVQ